MSKKKILTIAISVALVAILVVGASLAYFTDTKEATNTFTVGGVKIELLEKQRDYDDQGNLKDALVDFEQDKVLMPIAGSAQTAQKDQFGMPVVGNYVDKIVTIKNTGKSDAYIRAYFAIPSALDDGYEAFNAGLNILHFNFGNHTDGTTTYGNEWLWKNGNTWKYYETTIDGVKYNVYFADYATTVAPNATTEQFVQGVYLDKTFDATTDDTGATVYSVIQNGQTKVVDMSEFIVNGELGPISCPVFAVAVQADGFDTADAAITAAFGAQFNPWGTPVKDGSWQQ